MICFRADARVHRRMIESGMDITVDDMNPNIEKDEMSMTGQVPGNTGA